MEAVKVSREVLDATIRKCVNNNYSEHRVINKRKFQWKFARKIARAERVVYVNFSFSTYDTLSITLQVPRVIKLYLCVYNIFMRTRPAYLEILSSRWLNFSHSRESSRGTLVKPFDHTRNLTEQRCDSSLFSRFVCHITVRFIWQRIIHRHEIYCEAHCIAQLPTDSCQILSL